MSSVECKILCELSSLSFSVSTLVSRSLLYRVHVWNKGIIWFPFFETLDCVRKKFSCDGFLHSFETEQKEKSFFKVFERQDFPSLHSFCLFVGGNVAVCLFVSVDVVVVVIITYFVTNFCKLTRVIIFFHMCVCVYCATTWIIEFIVCCCCCCDYMCCSQIACEPLIKKKLKPWSISSLFYQNNKQMHRHKFFCLDNFSKHVHNTHLIKQYKPQDKHKIIWIRSLTLQNRHLLT